MTKSQKIIFKNALDLLESAIPRQEIIGGAALGLHKDKNGNKINNKWSGWAKESDEMRLELKECHKLFKILEEEILK